MCDRVSTSHSAAFAVEVLHEGPPCFEVERMLLSTTDEVFSTLVIPHLSVMLHFMPTRMRIYHSYLVHEVSTAMLYL